MRLQSATILTIRLSKGLDAELHGCEINLLRRQTIQYGQQKPLKRPCIGQQVEMRAQVLIWFL
jgi:hypothetical protein